jgi:hypothetical protein
MPLGMKRPTAASSALAKWPSPAEPEARAAVCGDSRLSMRPLRRREPAMAPSPARACWDSEPESAAGRAGPGPPPAGGRVDVTPKGGGGGHPRICQVPAGRARSWQTLLTSPRLPLNSDFRAPFRRRDHARVARAREPAQTQHGGQLLPVSALAATEQRNLKQTQADHLSAWLFLELALQLPDAPVEICRLGLDVRRRFHTLRRLTPSQLAMVTVRAAVRYDAVCAPAYMRMRGSYDLHRQVERALERSLQIAHLRIDHRACKK